MLGEKDVGTAGSARYYRLPVADPVEIKRGEHVWSPVFLLLLIPRIRLPRLWLAHFDLGIESLGYVQSSARVPIPAS